MNSTTAPTNRPNHTTSSGSPGMVSARSICTCALLLLMSVGWGLVARPARADDASLTIVRQDELDVAYDGYQMFVASVGDDGQAGRYAWPSDEMRETVLAVFDAHGYEAWFAATYPHSSEHDSARAAAEFVSSVLEGSDAQRSMTGRTTRLSERTSLSNDLARALTGNDALLPQTAQANEPFSGQQGYWLFVSHESEENPVGTAPILALLGSSTTTVTEKASNATLSIEVREDATGLWGKTADAQRGQLVSQRIEVTLPHNLDVYDQYHCLVTCTLPEGMTLHVPSGTTCGEALSVQVGSQTVDIGDAPATASYEHNVLSVDFADLIDPVWDECELVGDARIIIGFDALLNGEAKVGATGNLCRAQLTSTIDPVRERETTTAPANTMIFCYGLRLLKVDNQTGDPLQGAAFTLEECPEDGTSTTRSYIQADGSSGPQAHQFVSNENGTISISCLDEGRYLLHETAAPQGYELPGKDIELRIDAERLDESLSLKRVTVSIASGTAEVASIDETSGTATIRIQNARTTVQPTKTATSTGSPREAVQRLAQTGVGILAFALVGIGLALRSLSAFPLPATDGASQGRTRRRSKRASRKTPTG